MGFFDSIGNAIGGAVSDVGNYFGMGTGTSSYQPNMNQFKLPGYANTTRQSDLGYTTVGGANAGQINMAPQQAWAGQQQQLANMLNAQAQGGGPNLANEQLKQATDRNIAQAYAMAQSNPNNAGGARNVANQVAAANQEAAQQSAQNRMQQQFEAQGQLGGLLQGARGQDIGLAQGQAGLNAQMAQAYMNQQQNANNAQLQANIAQQQIASGAYQNQANRGQSFIGGAIGSLGSAIGLAHGGEVPAYAGGGPVGLGYFGVGMPEVTASSAPMFGKKSGKASATPGQPSGMPDMTTGMDSGLGMGDFAGADAAGAGGLSSLGAVPMVAARGGKIPGHPEYHGDDERNDIVDAKLSKGEIVLPNSVTQSSNAPEKAAKFVSDIKAKPVKEDEKYYHFDRGGVVFQVAKKGLGPSGMAAMKKHFVDGGKVTPVGDASSGWSAENPDRDEQLLGAVPATQAIAPAPGGDVVPSFGSMFGKYLENKAEEFRNTEGRALAGLPPVAAAPVQPRPEQNVPTNQAPAATNYDAMSMGTEPKVPDLVAGINKATAGEKKAEMEHAAALSAADKATANTIAVQIQQQKDLADQQFRDREEFNNSYTDAKATVANSQIDASRFMNNQGVAGHIKNAFALILGGIGGGMLHQENPVVGIINQKIQRDIDEQTANLDTKKGLLRSIMDKGHDLESSQKLAQATLLGVHSTELQKLAAENGSATAITAGRVSAAALDTKAQQLIGEALQRTDQLKKSAFEFQQLRDRPRLMAISMDAENGKIIPRKYGALLPADRKVPVGKNGDWALTATKDDRDKILEGRAASEEYNNSLNELESLKNTNSIIHKGTVSRQGVEALRRFVNASKAMSGKSGLGQSREEQQFEEGMGNPTDFFRTAEGTQQMIDAARNAGAIHLGALHKHYLIGGTGAARGLATNG